MGSSSYRFGFDNRKSIYGYTNPLDYASASKFSLDDLIQLGIVQSEDDLFLFNLGYSRPISFEAQISLNEGRLWGWKGVSSASP